MTASRPRICAAVTGEDADCIGRVTPLVDLFELRLDLVGEGWRGVAGQLGKPWIATNRRAAEGGAWQGGETERMEVLLEALESGASVIDMEVDAPGAAELVNSVKGRAECLLSYHNPDGTPPPEELAAIIERQLAAGADICKVITTARTLGDGLSVLNLIREFPQAKVVAFAMGEAGRLSRVLCPLAGGYFTFASLAPGKESADGQLTVDELRKIYAMIGKS